MRSSFLCIERERTHLLGGCVISDIHKSLQNQVPNPQRAIHHFRKCPHSLWFNQRLDVGFSLASFTNFTDFQRPQRTALHAQLLQSCPDSLRPYGLQPTRLLCSWDSPGKNARTGCYFLLQGIFLILRSNSCLLCLLHWQADSLPLCHLRSSFKMYRGRKCLKIGFFYKQQEK